MLPNSIVNRFLCKPPIAQRKTHPPTHPATPAHHFPRVWRWRRVLASRFIFEPKSEDGFAIEPPKSLGDERGGVWRRLRWRKKAKPKRRLAKKPHCSPLGGSRRGPKEKPLGRYKSCSHRTTHHQLPTCLFHSFISLGLNMKLLVSIGFWG